MGQVLGYDVFLVWDKAEDITNIDIHRKENTEIKSYLIKCLKNSQTFSFLKYNLDSFDKNNKKISYNLQEIKEEFPGLFEKNKIIDSGYKQSMNQLENIITVLFKEQIKLNKSKYFF